MFCYDHQTSDETPYWALKLQNGIADNRADAENVCDQNNLRTTFELAAFFSYNPPSCTKGQLTR
jgi:hypothetical protein